MKRREIASEGKVSRSPRWRRRGRREEEGGIEMWRLSEYNYPSLEKIPVQSAKAHVSICECIFIGLPGKGRKDTQRGMGNLRGGPAVGSHRHTAPS